MYIPCYQIPRPIPVLTTEAVLWCEEDNERAIARIQQEIRDAARMGDVELVEDLEIELDIELNS